MSSLPLLDRHRAVLSDRGIDDAVIAARGYLSVQVKSHVERYGFGPSSHVYKSTNSVVSNAALMIPLWRAGDTAPEMYQARPDTPYGEGKSARKYELPARKQPPSDCNPYVTERGWVFDVDVPVVITEGALKGDALLSAAILHDIPLCPVGLIGVTGGMLRDHTIGARFLAPDLLDLCRPNRRVLIAFDSDWKTNPNVCREMFKLMRTLIDRACSVAVIDIPSDANGNKQGADDWLVANERNLPAFLELAVPEDAPELEEIFSGMAATAVVDRGPKRSEHLEVDFENHRVIESRWKTDPQGGMTRVDTVVAEFSGRVVREVSQYTVTENGKVERGNVEAEVEFCWFDDSGELHREKLTLPLADLGSMSKWRSKSAALARRWVSGSRSVQDQVAIAIASDHRHDDQMDPEISVTSASGWVRVGRDAPWRYVHANGAVAGVGDDLHMMVSPDTDVRRLTMPPPASPDVALRWVRETMMCKNPDLPLGAVGGVDLPSMLVLGAIWAFRAVLPIRPLTTPVYLVGTPQCGKSAVAKSWSSYFGRGFVQQMFASMKDTAVGMELKMAAARHMGVVIDDVNFASRRDVDGQTQAIDRMVRAAHDQAERTRGRADMTLRASPPMMATLCFTGETMPDTSGTDSLVSRLLVIQFPERLKEAELEWLAVRNRDPGQYAVHGQVLSSFVRWLSSKMDAWQVSHPEELSGRVFGEFSAEATTLVDSVLDSLSSTDRERVAKDYSRTTAGMVNLALGFAAMAAWARELGCDDDDIDKMASKAQLVLELPLKSTIRTIVSHNPANMVAEGISEVLRSGKGHIVYYSGQNPPPSVAASWGWFADSNGTLTPRGLRIGRVVSSERVGSNTLHPVHVLVDPLPLGRALSDLGYSFVRNIKHQLRDAKVGDTSILSKVFNPGELAASFAVDGKVIRAIGIRPDLFGIQIPDATHHGDIADIADPAGQASPAPAPAADAETGTSPAPAPGPALKVLRADLEM